MPRSVLQRGADSGPVIHASDGCIYQTKDTKTGGSSAGTPHAEWFCTHLGEAVGIAAPPCKIIDMRDGTFVFGSRWEGGVLQPDVAGHWWERVKAGAIPVDDVKPTLSRVYAFDQFVQNGDRHLNNFIVREQPAGHAMLANDYSRAWIASGWPLSPAPLPPVTNTVVWQRQLAQDWNVRVVDKDEADQVLELLSKVSKDHVKRIIEDHPENWLSSHEKTVILDWWNSADMNTRISRISDGIADGSAL